MVNDTAKLIERLVGEDVEFVTELDETLWDVKADPAQVEQILMNLGSECPRRDAGWREAG